MLHRYPLGIRPFYTMPCKDDERYSCSFDIFIRGEEIISGAQVGPGGRADQERWLRQLLWQMRQGTGPSGLPCQLRPGVVFAPLTADSPTSLSVCLPARLPACLPAAACARPSAADAAGRGAGPACGDHPVLHRLIQVREQKAGSGQGWAGEGWALAGCLTKPVAVHGCIAAGRLACLCTPSATCGH